MRIVKAEALEPGQKILVAPGRVEIVDAATEYDKYGGVTIHTTRSDILTQLPCDVKVID